MLFSSNFPPNYSRHRAAALRPLRNLRFFSTTANKRVSLYEDDFIQHSTTAEFLSDCLSDGRHSDVLSLLRRTPPSRYLVFYWNSLIKRSATSVDHSNVLHLFDEMRRLKWIPDSHTHLYVLKACGDLPSPVVEASVHALALVTGFTYCNMSVDSAAITMYGGWGEHDIARLMFDEMLEGVVYNKVSWNSIISVYVQIGDSRKALRLFKEMVSRGDLALLADAVSLTNVLRAGASLISRRQGAEVHAYAIRGGLIENVFVGSVVVDMYAKCKNLKVVRPLLAVNFPYPAGNHPPLEKFS